MFHNIFITLYLNFRTSHSLGVQSIRSRYGMEKKRSATMDQPLLEVEQQVTEENNRQQKLSAALSEKESRMITNEKVVDSKVVDKIESNTNNDANKNAGTTLDDDVRCRKSSIPQDTSTSSHSTTPPDTPTNTESTLKLSDGDESKGDDILNLPKKCDIAQESSEINVQQSHELITQAHCEKSNSSEKIKNEPQQEISLDIYAEYTDDQDDPTSNDSDSSDISETEGDLTQQIISENLSDNSLFKESEQNIQSSCEYDGKTGKVTLQIDFYLWKIKYFRTFHEQAINFYCHLFFFYTNNCNLYYQVDNHVCIFTKSNFIFI